MISIIVSSYNKQYFETFSKSVSQTIGVPYEIVQIENPGIMGVCKAYNIGFAKAQFPYICFCHEDILFHTNDWGPLLIDVLKDRAIDLIGVAGSKIKSKLPGGWVNGIPGYDHVHILQSSSEQGIIWASNMRGAKRFEQVRVLDGVFLMTTHDVFQNIKFDETIPGFHFYDIDFSMRVSKTHKCFVVNLLLIEHLSEGNYGDDWVRSSIEFHKKSRSFDKITKWECSEIRKFWYYRLRMEKINLKNRIAFALAMRVDKRAFFDLLKFLIGFVKPSPKNPLIPYIGTDKT